MRISLLSLFSLAALALADTYAKIDNEEWYLTFDIQGYHTPSERYTLCLYNTSQWSSRVTINNNTALYLSDAATYFDVTVGPNITLGGSSARQDAFTIYNGGAIEKRSTLPGTPVPGFSWAPNGTLQLDHDGFYGWIKCDNYSTVPIPTIAYVTRVLYWATEPIKDLPSYCEQVTFSKYEDN